MHSRKIFVFPPSSVSFACTLSSSSSSFSSSAAVCYTSSFSLSLFLVSPRDWGSWQKASWRKRIGYRKIFAALLKLLESKGGREREREMVSHALFSFPMFDEISHFTKHAQAKLNSFRALCMTVSLTAQNTSLMFSVSVRERAKTRFPRVWACRVLFERKRNQMLGIPSPCKGCWAFTCDKRRLHQF